MIGQMAIAIALLGFNDLGRSLNPFRNRFYLQLSPYCPKMNKKSLWEVKKIHDFCPRDMGSYHLAARRVDPGGSRIFLRRGAPLRNDVTDR